MDARCIISVVIMHTNPITDARHIDCRFGRVHECTCRLGGYLPMLISDDTLASINRRYPSNSLIRCAESTGQVLKPMVHSQFDQFHRSTFQFPVQIFSQFLEMDGDVQGRAITPVRWRAKWCRGG